MVGPVQPPMPHWCGNLRPRIPFVAFDGAAPPYPPAHPLGGAIFPPDWHILVAERLLGLL